MDQNSPVVSVQQLRDQIAGLEAEKEQARVNFIRAEGALAVLQGMLGQAERQVIVEQEKARKDANDLEYRLHPERFKAGKADDRKSLVMETVELGTMAVARNEVCCPHPVGTREYTTEDGGDTLNFARLDQIHRSFQEESQKDNFFDELAFQIAKDTDPNANPKDFYPNRQEAQVVS